MSIEVKTFDERAILKDLKESGKTEAIALIKAYKRAMEGHEHVLALARKKIKELTNG